MNFGRWNSGRFGRGRVASGAVRLGSALALIGGILMIVFALLGSLGSLASLGLFRGIPMAYAFGSGIVAGMGVLVDLVGGVLAIFGSRRAYSLIWGVVLLIIGLVVGGWGGLLVLVGAIIALVASHV